MSQNMELSEFETYTQPKRDTKKDLIQAIFTQARAAGDLAEIDPILDYILPSDSEPLCYYQNTVLTNYQFDVVPTISFGESEGIYVDVRLQGQFDASGKDTTYLATIKSLQDDLHACKLMGELCGVIIHHANAYLNKNIHRYTPQQELETQYQWKQGRSAK